MLDSLNDALTVKTVFGAIGAVPGSLRAMSLSRARGSGRMRATSDALMGVVFAISVSEMMTPDSQPHAALLVGLLAGLVGGRALDALFELVPEVVRALALGWAKKVGGEGAARGLRQSTDWTDLTYPPRTTRPTGRFTKKETDDADTDPH